MACSTALGGGCAERAVRTIDSAKGRRRMGWGVLAALAVGLLAGPRAHANGQLGPDNLWDANKGLVVTATSDLSPGSSGENMFFGVGGGAEPENTVFANAPGGFTHFIDWRTPAPVTVCRIDLFAYDNPGLGDRGYTEFRLYARNMESQQFEFVTSFTPGNPYPQNDGFNFGSTFAVLDFAAVTAQEFRAEFDQLSSCNEALGVRIADLRAFGPGPSVVESYFLPKRVAVKVNASDASKSSVVASGFFDLGPNAPNLASAATLDVGGLHFDIPTLASSGKAFSFTGGGADFAITPNPSGSSRAKFRLKFAGDVTGKVAADGPLALAFSDAAASGNGSVSLTRGLYGLGKLRGALVAPNLFVVRTKATLKGAGQDALSVIVGIASGGATPGTASDLTVAFGDKFSATIPAAQFSRKGDVDSFSGNAGGITRVSVDYGREMVSITGKGLDLGTFAEGANSVLVRVSLGSDTRLVRVRMARKGTAMKY